MIINIDTKDTKLLGLLQDALDNPEFRAKLTAERDAAKKIFNLSDAQLEVFSKLTDADWQTLAHLRKDFVPASFCNGKP